MFYMNGLINKFYKGRWMSQHLCNFSDWESKYTVKMMENIRSKQYNDLSFKYKNLYELPERYKLLNQNRIYL
jgi:hypothetical protein